MKPLESLLINNRIWRSQILRDEPQFFERLARQQRPAYLWIGCSDSRVPANQIVGLAPGEVFVHRNIANQVLHSDMNCLSVIEYAVDALHVPHIIVCGHYGCGGVHAALRNDRLGLSDNWLRHVRDLRQMYAAQLDALPDEADRFDRLAELNVIEQVKHVCQTTIVENAWSRGARLSVHGWIYGIQDGLLRDLCVSVCQPGELVSIVDQALERWGAAT